MVLLWSLIFIPVTGIIENNTPITTSPTWRAGAVGSAGSTQPGLVSRVSSFKEHIPIRIWVSEACKLTPSDCLVDRVLPCAYERSDALLVTCVISHWIVPSYETSDMSEAQVLIPL